jgi:alpha-methylacyl-CoA racemase
MLLSDMGAQVITIERPGYKSSGPEGIVERGRQVVIGDLKNEASLHKILELIDGADVLVEGFRPGVMERLGLGPIELFKRNPRLIYGRMTGWGQDGPLALQAGHDANYISISGALHAIGQESGSPVLPLNLVGDYGGGSMYLITGILAALFERQSSGKGQIVDAAITDGAISLMSHFFASLAKGDYIEKRSSNMLDGGLPYYCVYETSDGKHVSVGPLEPKFFEEFATKLGLDERLKSAHQQQALWPELRIELTKIFKTNSRDYWTKFFEATDACVAPILSMSEVDQHPHNQHRQAVVEINGVKQPAPAPRFSRTPSAIQATSLQTDQDLEQLIAQWKLK